MLPVITNVGRSPAMFARLAKPDRASQSRGVEMMLDCRCRSIPDLGSRLDQLPSEQRVLAETQRSGAEFRFECGNALQGRAAETHAGADELVSTIVDLVFFVRI